MCALAFIVYNKVSFVTTMASDVSGVIILIDINLLNTVSISYLYTILWLTCTELW